MTTTVRKWYEWFTSPRGQESEEIQRGYQHCPSRVLLGEDDHDLRLLVSRVLQRDGYEVIEACDGMEILDQLQDALFVPIKMPDVIILDILMPKYSGLSVLTALRRANWFTPVIVMSAIGEETICQKARDLGAVAFFKKPFDMDELRTAVVNASLRNSRAKTISELD